MTSYGSIFRVLILRRAFCVNASVLVFATFEGGSFKLLIWLAQLVTKPLQSSPILASTKSWRYFSASVRLLHLGLPAASGRYCQAFNFNTIVMAATDPFP